VRLSVLAALEALRTPFTDARVHAARRALKQARAELRLVRGSIGEAHFRAANRRLRDVGRSLSPWRDARVLIDACDAIGAELVGPAPRRLLRELRAELELERRGLRRSSREVEHLTEGAREGLARMLEQARRWPSGPLDAELLAAGAARIYRRGRRSLAAARHQPDPRVLHEWRKQSLYLAEGLRALGGGRGRRIDALAGRASHLAHALGEHRDLHLLQESLLARVGRGGDAAAVKPVTALIARRRKMLARAALNAGDALYTAKPEAFETRLGKALLHRR
jgi:hypothetical protein